MAVRSADFDCQLHHLCIGSDGNARRCHIDLFSFVHFGYVDFLFIMEVCWSETMGSVQRNAFLKHVALAAGQSQRACAWPRDCRDKHLLPTDPLALQEL